MALEQPITKDDHFFTGEDKDLEFTICQADGVTPQNITGWSFSWILKTNSTDADVDAKVTKTTGAGGISITGTYSADPALNTQRAVVAAADTDTVALAAGRYHHELKRTDEDSETVLAFGPCILRPSLHKS
jgi:hypothetical protein